MKPENLKELQDLADLSTRDLYTAIADVAARDGGEIAVRQSKPSSELTYAQLVEDADFMSRNIPFENHPVELDMEPGIGVVVAIVAALQRGCRPVASDRVSKVKLIINDNTVRISSSPPKHNPFIQYMVKGINAVHSSRPDLEFNNRRQLRRQDFIDSLIKTLIEGGRIQIKKN